MSQPTLFDFDEFSFLPPEIQELYPTTRGWPIAGRFGKTSLSIDPSGKLMRHGKQVGVYDVHFLRCIDKRRGLWGEEIEHYEVGGDGGDHLRLIETPAAGPFWPKAEVWWELVEEGRR